MNPRTLIVGALALACGLSVLFLFQTMQKPGAAAVPKAEVVFAAADIRPGETVAEAMVEIRQVAADSVPEGAILKVADAVGRASQGSIDKGDLLREKKLAERGAGQGMAALVRKGMRAFTIQTPSFSSSLAGFILPGNKVDVLLTMNSPGGPDDVTGGASTMTLLQNVEILAVHTTVNTPTTNKINPDDARSVTLLVSPDEVERLDLGQNRGTLHLSLRNHQDTGTAKPLPVTMIGLQDMPARTLSLAAAPPPPQPAPAPTPAPAREPTWQRLTIRTLRGTQAGADTLTVLDTSPAPPTPARAPTNPAATAARPGGKPGL